MTQFFWKEYQSENFDFAVRKLFTKPLNFYDPIPKKEALQYSTIWAKWKIVRWKEKTTPKDPGMC